MSHISRWAMISRLNREGVLYIHKKEQESFDFAAKQTDRVSGKVLINDQILSVGDRIMVEAVERSEHHRFWPPRTKKDVKEFTVDRFRRMIYPLWKPLEDAQRAGKMEWLRFIHDSDKKIWKASQDFGWGTETGSNFKKPDSMGWVNK